MAGRLLAALVAAAALACASAHNYLDPQGPVYRFEGEAERSAPGPGAPLRVVTFNVAFAIHVERAIEVLRESAELRGADLVALQEMDAPGTERIARALGMNAVYFPSGVHPRHRRDFGCAILSPWPLAEPLKLLLPHGARGSGLRRAATAATLQRGAERVRVYSVHLSAPLSLSGRARGEQLQLLAEDAARNQDPVLILGDFNTHDKVGELEAHGFRWLTRDVGATLRYELLGIPLAHPSFDHILARGLRLAAPGAFGVVEDNRDASDHKPVWALVEPLPDEACAPRR